MYMMLLVILSLIVTSTLCSEYTSNELTPSAIFSGKHEEEFKIVIPIPKRGRYDHVGRYDNVTFEDNDDYYNVDYIPSPFNSTEADQDCNDDSDESEEDDDNWFASLESFRNRSTKKYSPQVEELDEDDEDGDKENMIFPDFDYSEPSTSSLNGYTANEVANITELNAKDITFKPSTLPRISSNTTTFLCQLGGYSIENINYIRVASKN